MKNTSGNIPYQLDPDRLTLSKKDILKFCDRAIQEWSKNKIANWRFIAGMEIFKAGLMIFGEKTLMEIWKKILAWFNELLFENAIKQMQEDGLDYYKIFDALKKKALTNDRS